MVVQLICVYGKSPEESFLDKKDGRAFWRSLFNLIPTQYTVKFCFDHDFDNMRQEIFFVGASKIQGRVACGNEVMLGGI